MEYANPLLRLPSLKMAHNWKIIAWLETMDGWSRKLNIKHEMEMSAGNYQPTLSIACVKI